jgi:hypothetical protein
VFALLVPLIARAAPPAAPAAPREETPTAVLAEGLHLETPGDVVGRNFRPADLLAFGQRTDEAALESLARLHPRHRLEVTFRYTLSPDKPHDVEVAIEPDELGEADIAAIRAALLKVPTARSATDPVSFTRRYAVRGSAEEAGQDEGPPVWGRSVPDAASETAAAAALAEIAAGGPFGHFGKVLVVGPSLYTALLRKDPQLKGVGVPFKIMVSGQERMRMVDGRLFRGDEVASFLKAGPPGDRGGARRLFQPDFVRYRRNAGPGRSAGQGCAARRFRAAVRALAGDRLSRALNP